LQEAILSPASRYELRREIDFAGGGSFESVFERDILKAGFCGLKEAAGEPRIGEMYY
jgi:hypothetical protein